MPKSAFSFGARGAKERGVEDVAPYSKKKLAVMQGAALHPPKVLFEKSTFGNRKTLASKGEVILMQKA